MKRLLLPFLEPGRSLPLYLLGTTVITLLIQLLLDWSNNPGQWQGSYALTLIVMLLTITAAALWAYQNRPQRLYLLDEQKPRPRRGLILLVSKHKAAAPAAIDHHLPILTDCWLISTAESAAVAAELAAAYSSETTSCHFGTPYLVNDDDAASTYRIARKILTVEAAARGLGSVDMIADITGGSKPMTAGLVLACVSERQPIQYVMAKKDEKGQVLFDTYGEPIKINLEYFTFRQAVDSIPPSVD